MCTEYGSIRHLAGLAGAASAAAAVSAAASRRSKDRSDIVIVTGITRASILRSRPRLGHRSCSAGCGSLRARPIHHLHLHLIESWSQDVRMLALGVGPWEAVQLIARPRRIQFVSAEQPKTQQQLRLLDCCTLS